MIRQFFAAAALLSAAVAQAHPAAGHEHHNKVLEAKHIYVVRHLQKADGQDPPLTAEGVALAERLADRLAANGIEAIFATPTRRAMETARPLAARLGVEVRLYDPRDPGALVGAVAVSPGNVLVVGHSNTVHDLVARFGGAAPAPLDESDYGTVWHVDPAGMQTRTFILADGGAPTAR